MGTIRYFFLSFVGGSIESQMTDNLPKVGQLFCESQKPRVLKLALVTVTSDDLCFKSFLNQKKASGGILRNTTEYRIEAE